MTKSTVQSAAALEAAAKSAADVALPNYVDDKVRHTPDVPASETTVELATGVTQVNYL